VTGGVFLRPLGAASIIGLVEKVGNGGGRRGGDWPSRDGNEPMTNGQRDFPRDSHSLSRSQRESYRLLEYFWGSQHLNLLPSDPLILACTL
jgi:hypothetical protein